MNFQNAEAEFWKGFLKYTGFGNVVSPCVAPIFLTLVVLSVCAHTSNIKVQKYTGDLDAKLGRGRPRRRRPRQQRLEEASARKTGGGRAIATQPRASKGWTWRSPRKSRGHQALGVPKGPLGVPKGVLGIFGKDFLLVLLMV